MEAMRTKNFFPKTLVISISFFIFCVLAATGTAVAATYYIATTGNDSYSKAQAQNAATPWRTLQKAAGSVAAGDKVIVKAGTYTAASGVMCTITTSGTASNPITFQSENPATTNANHAILDCNWVADIGIAIGGNYITIDGFEIKNVKASGGGAGIMTGTVQNIKIIRNRIHHVGSKSSLISDNAYGRSGIFAGSGSYNWTIDSNIIHDIGRVGGSAGVGRWVFNSGNGNDGKHDHPMYLEFHDSVIANNLFYNTDTGPFRGWPILLYDANNSVNNKKIKVINNTLIGPSVNTSYGLGHIYLYGNQQVSNVMISNNISYQPTGNATIALGGGGSVVSSTARNNITTAASLAVGATSSNFTLSTNTLNVPIGNPMFVNASSHDYHLASGSLARHYAYLSDLPDHDLEGSLRPQGAGGDAGAYEYPASTAAAPAATPVGYFKMNEGSGQVATDSSGQGNSAVLGNTTSSEAIDPTWTTGMTGYALLFNGSNDVTTIPHKASLDNLKKFTISVWINPSASAGSPRIISKESAQQGFDDFYLCVSPATGYLGVAVVNATGKQVVSSINNAILPNQWNHVVVTYDDTGDRKCHLYVNGFEFLYARQDTMTGTLKTSANDWKIGNNAAGNRAFGGRIDNLRIFNRALSASEIADLYDQDNQ